MLPRLAVQVARDLVSGLHTCAGQVDLSEPSLVLVTLTTHEVIPLDFGSHPLKMCKKKNKNKKTHTQV